VLPYLAGSPGTPIADHQLATTLPLTHAYFAEFERELRRRPRFRNFNPAEGEAWELHNVGAYTFARYKVCWREQMGTFTVAVAYSEHGGKAPVVDHKLVSVGLDDADEVFYLSAVLNSTPVRVLVDSFALELSLSSSLLDYVRVPRFSAGTPGHRTLADLGRQAHGPLIAGQRSGLEEQIDRVAGELWGVPAGTLEVIREYAHGIPAVAGDVEAGEEVAQDADESG
jgi:hypothetical protein